MPIEIVDNPDGEFLSAAFALIKQKHSEGFRFSNDQKDIAVLVTIDALPPVEQPWFHEIAAMLKIPLWQALWGQWRRCQENGNANAPVLDPGWEGELTGAYGMEDRPCEVCSEVFKPEHRGQLYCSNACGAEVERRARPRSAVEPVIEREPVPLFVPPTLTADYAENLSPWAKLQQQVAEPVDEGESVRLSTDFVPTE